MTVHPRRRAGRGAALSLAARDGLRFLIRSDLRGLALGLALGCCDSGPVRNPADAALRCGQRPEHENNCNACTSQPACGWCEQPQTGQTRCQAASDTPTGCSGEFRRSPNECAAPQEAPPGAVE